MPTHVQHFSQLEVHETLQVSNAFHEPSPQSRNDPGDALAAFERADALVAARFARRALEWLNNDGFLCQQCNILAPAGA